VHMGFLAEFHATPMVEQSELLQQWQDYLDAMQKDWEFEKDKMVSYLETKDKVQFIRFFHQFSEKWTQTMPVKVKPLVNTDKTEKIYESLLAQQQFFQPLRQAIPIQKNYDIADDGQARIYSTLFAQTRATLRGERPLFANFRAWREGRGVLFADLRATLHGDRPLFANLRATIHRLLETIKAYFARGQSNEEANPSNAEVALGT
jgi:hypothetical protein